MSYTVYLRPLVVEDALISYQWRNNPKIWRFTGSKPDREITPEIETAWIQTVLARDNEKRFAICLQEDDTYIGNIFFTDIQNGEAQIHIFIGDVQCWGHNRGWDACYQAIEHAFDTMQLDRLVMEMHRNNPGIGGVKKMGWHPVREKENGFVDYFFTKADFDNYRRLA